jgi:predicted nucleic acid-binding protein
LPVFLADTSAWHWSGRAGARWFDLFEAGAIATCAPVKLELLYSARGARDYDQLASDLARLPYLRLDEQAAETATAAQAALARRAQHRLPAVDFLVAAVAEAAGAVLLHYDRHFDAIARVTGQPMEWLARRGSLG